MTAAPLDPPPTPDEDRLAAAADAVRAGADPASVAGPADTAHLSDLRRVAGLLVRLAADVRAAALADPPPADTTVTWEPVPSTVPDPFPGDYRFVEVVGRGAFGEVWKADDLHLGIPVAVKVLAADTPAARLAADTLRHEARVLAGLRHPNVIGVFALRPAGGRFHLVMRYVAGGSFADRVRRDGPLAWAAAARYVADAADGLRAVHAAGLAHRDIKPGNLLWDAAADEAVLTDFGLAARLGRPADPGGTPAYMPADGWADAPSAAADVFGLAATLFALATGGPPFPGPSAAEVAARALAGLPDPDPRLAGVPTAIERAVRAGLAPDPAARPPLDRFTADLRGALNRSLADTLTHGRAGPAVGLTVAVDRHDPGGSWAPVDPAAPPRPVALRDMAVVPAEPDRVGLRTGDRVRVRVSADAPGFVAVFNVGPTGNLPRLFPRPGADGAIAPGQPVQVLDVAMTPPAGRERVFAVWARQPLPADPAALNAVAAADAVGATVPPAYRATRDMQSLTQSFHARPPGNWQAVVLELDHRPA